MEGIIIKDFDQYIIDRKGNVTNIITSKNVKHSINKGYYYVHLQYQGKSYNRSVHRLLAQAYIPNPEDYTEVDHIDCNKENNNLENLRWVSRSQNLENQNGSRGKLFRFVDQLPEDSVEIEIYSGHYFEDYYWTAKENKLYFNNGVRIREMNLIQSGNYLVYCCRDINNKQILIPITRLQKGLFNNE
ncbi:Conserved_hypothetical protein [Hexamita inflata]|uniref:HNH nuclease domain-containing protein n=1 Tax=Hexamita inflata TaxID=28002 RepID=A0AA86UD84_9EUKA|nr:Conserved hypothetical protein [Hexamita inflata]